MKLSDSAETFFVNVVVPNCDEHFAKPSDIRIAANAVISLNHVVDWVSNESGIDFKTFKAQVEGECPALNALRELANGVKHSGDKWPALTSNPTYDELNVSWDQAKVSWDQMGQTTSMPMA